MANMTAPWVNTLPYMPCQFQFQSPSSPARRVSAKPISISVRTTASRVLRITVTAYSVKSIRKSFDADAPLILRRASSLPRILSNWTCILRKLIRAESSISEPATHITTRVMSDMEPLPCSFNDFTLTVMPAGLSRASASALSCSGVNPSRSITSQYGIQAASQSKSSSS